MKIHHQSVFDRWPLEDQSIQAIITSPPYWGLRKYDIPDVVIGGDPGCRHKFIETIVHIKGNGDERRNRRDRKAGIKICRCGAWKGQYGLEPSFKDFIEHTAFWVEEAWRVLKNDGVMFLNLGDSYGGSWGAYGGTAKKQFGKDVGYESFKPSTINARAKCKLLIPHRVAISLIDDDGWILRNDIVWHKPNAMPESTGDRFSKKFEYIFMFVKSERYFFNLDAVREPHKEVSLKRIEKGWKSNHPSIGHIDTERMGDRFCNPKGKNPGDLWSISAQPSPEEHYAIWPEKLVERMVLCSTKPGDAILDPFVGSGTTLRTAGKFNRTGVGIDLGYKEIQERRLTSIQKELII